jgi:hypothetical protein
VISGLAVLLCSEDRGLPEFSDIRASINKPSILVDEIVQRVYGIGRIVGSWAHAHSGQAPASFIVERYFDDHKKSHVPAILSSKFQELEERSRLPFTRQWAYEWQQLMSATGSPYSGFPYHFIGANLRQSGIHGQFSQPQCNVYRSAFLKEPWHLPFRNGECRYKRQFHAPIIVFH